MNLRDIYERVAFPLPVRSPEEKAYENLLTHLTPRQITELTSPDTIPLGIRTHFYNNYMAADARGFRVAGSRGGHYLVLYKDNPNVIRLGKEFGWPFGQGQAYGESFCIYAPYRGYAGQGALPLADFILTLTLTIQFDEGTFLHTANRFGGPFGYL